MGYPYNYKDLLKASPLNEDQVESVLSNTTVIQNLPGTPLSDDTPLIDLGAGSAGASTEASRGDHVHPIIADATTAAKGKVELATSLENAASVVVQGNDGRINVCTAKGDLYTYSTVPAKLGIGTDGSTLVADASQTTGNHWMFGTAFWFGSGADSSSTLGANTALAAGLGVHRNYTTLDLVTYTLKANVSTSTTEKAWVVCCSVLLTGSGGSIVSPRGTQNLAGGAARVQGGSSGAGGDNTDGQYSTNIHVYARALSGTVTLNGNGGAGSDGGNASGVPTGIQTGAAGGAVAATSYYCSEDIAGGNPTGGGAGGASGGSAGGAGSASVSNDSLYSITDPLRAIMDIRTAPASGGVADGVRWLRLSRVGGATSGGSGAITNSTAASGGGGGGGSCGVLGTIGKAGGGGGAGAGTIGAGGGGGAGGGPGCMITCVIGEFIAGAVFSATANGANGGNGGNGISNGGGGGGGAGGCGGRVFLLLPVNYATNATVTCTATAGTQGAKGLKAGLGSDGSAGNAGTAGTTAIITWYG
jgi:hypothetical protein